MLGEGGNPTQKKVHATLVNECCWARGALYTETVMDKQTAPAPSGPENCAMKVESSSVRLQPWLGLCSFGQVVQPKIQFPLLTDGDSKRSSYCFKGEKRSSL